MRNILDLVANSKKDLLLGSKYIRRWQVGTTRFKMTMKRPGWKTR